MTILSFEFEYQLPESFLILQKMRSISIDLISVIIYVHLESINFRLEIVIYGSELLD